MTHDYPHVPAAFINNIRDEGTKEEACDYLQKQWNETRALRELCHDLSGKISTLTVERNYLLSVNKMWHEVDQALTIAAQDFIAKVDRGEAKSVRSYAAFKDALAIRERKT